MKKIKLSIFLLLIFASITLTGCDQKEISSCENLNVNECLEHQDRCQICAETITSSFAGCHSIEFCQEKERNIIPSQPIVTPKDKGEETNETTKQYENRDQAIEEYLLTQKEFAWQTESVSQNGCIFENLGNKDDLFPLSLWVYCQEYKIENGDTLELSGISIPVLLDYPNELSFFQIDKFSHKIPRDGSLYAEDIKKIFPKDVQDKILNFEKSNNLDESFRKKIL